MKNLFLFLFLMMSINSYPQEITQPQPFSKFHFALFGGPNLTFPIQFGYLLQFEAKANLTSKINIKASIGISSIYKYGGDNISVSQHYTGNQSDYYLTQSYKIDKYEYAVVPLSLGLEYALTEEKYTPYILCEGGYNLYAVEVHKSNEVLGAYGTFNPLERMGFQYNFDPSKTPTAASFRLGLGLGTRVRLTNDINFELRYLYNINSTILNNHQLMIGISI